MKKTGFTLVELMVTIAILGILAGIAYPQYTSYVVESNRSEAIRDLVRIANLQEQYYVDNRGYTADMTQLGLSADPFVSQSGHYQIDATLASGGYTLTATAQGSQATNDSSCLTITITDTGLRSGASSDCWD